MNTFFKNLSIIQGNKSYCFPQCTSLFYAERLSMWKKLAAGIKYTANTARQTLKSSDPVDKSLNHATIAEDWAHSHRPHEKGRRERGKSDFHGSDQPYKRPWNSAASGQNHMTLAHRKSPNCLLFRATSKSLCLHTGGEIRATRTCKKGWEVAFCSVHTRFRRKQRKKWKTITVEAIFVLL